MCKSIKNFQAGFAKQSSWGWQLSLQKRPSWGGRTTLQMRHSEGLFKNSYNDQFEPLSNFLQPWIIVPQVPPLTTMGHLGPAMGKLELHFLLNLSRWPPLCNSLENIVSSIDRNPRSQNFSQYRRVSNYRVSNLQYRVSSILKNCVFLSFFAEKVVF